MTLNIPIARGVPGFETPGMREPQWWDTSAGASPPGDQNVDSAGLPNDPRWNQATRHEWATGTTTEGILRALYEDETGVTGQHVLYLSFQVQLDPTVSIGTDAVFLGLQSGANNPHIFEFDAYSNPTQPVQTPVVNVWNLDTSRPNHYTSGWSGGGTQPDWTLTARTFLTVAGSAPNQTATWAVNVRVPMIAAGGDLTNAGIELGTTFQFYLAIIKDTAPGAVPYLWPRAAAPPYLDTSRSPFEMAFPAVSTWDTAQLGAGGAGISLNAGDIGTENPVPNEILYSTAHDTLNTLYADVTNTSGATIPAGTLRARFRIANWGSQPWADYLAGPSDWEEVPPPTPPVRTNANDIHDPPTTPAERRIEDPWTITQADATAWIAAGKTSHQCLLVELSGVAPAQYDFVNDSAFNNMSFIQVASTVDNTFQIRLPQTVGRRGFLRGIFRPTSVYMFVATSNMPASMPPDHPLPPRWITPLHPIAEPLTAERLATAIPADHLNAAVPDLMANPRGPVTIDHLAKILTTIQYFVYVGTGKKIEVGGKVRPLLVQQTSFGYFIQHQRPIYGWDSALGGNFTSIGGNMYKLPVGGTTKIASTRIIGYESTPPAQRLAPIIAGPAGPIQSKIPVLNKLPAIGGLLRHPTASLRG
jgi:hypothetical protein